MLRRSSAIIRARKGLYSYSPGEEQRARRPQVSPRKQNNFVVIQKIKAPGGSGAFYWFFHSENYFLSAPEGMRRKKRASDRHRRPVLTSETTKRKISNIFSLISCCLGDSSLPLLNFHSSPMPFCYNQPYSTRHFPDKSIFKSKTVNFEG